MSNCCSTFVRYRQRQRRSFAPILPKYFIREDQDLLYPCTATAWIQEILVYRDPYNISESKDKISAGAKRQVVFGTSEADCFLQLCHGAYCING